MLKPKYNQLFNQAPSNQRTKPQLCSKTISFSHGKFCFGRNFSPSFRLLVSAFANVFLKASVCAVEMAKV
jgi:hypothetical protein